MATNGPTRPLPETRNAGAAYWLAAAKGTLVLPNCGKCDHAFWHPRPRCPYCGSGQVDWSPSKGRGVIHTFTVVRNSPDPFFKARVPYVVAMVQLDEGPMLMTNIADCDVNAVKVGMRVRATFEAATNEISIPIFVLDHE